jgi:hypothetical protein
MLALKPRESYDMALQARICGERFFTLESFITTGLIVESAQAGVGREMLALKPRESYNMALQVRICGKRFLTLETFITTGHQ